MRRVRTVEGAERETRHDLAGDDAIQRVRPRESTEREIGEQTLRRGTERDQRRPVVGIGNADSLEGAVQGIAQREGEARARLRVVLQVLKQGRRQVQPLASKNFGLLRLVEVELSGVNRESRLQRAVPQVGLGESELEIALAVTDVCADAESFPQAQKIVGLVSQADESSGQAADAAGEADAVLALFMDFQEEVHCASLFVEAAIGHVGIIRLQLLEVSQLIQAEQAEFPQTRVVN